MTQYGLPFDGVLLGDASVAPYSAAEWANTWGNQHGVGALYRNAGVFPGQSNNNYPPLGVHPNSPAASNVIVETGAALVNGRFYENTAAETLSIGANVSGNDRIDTVILRLDVVAQTIRLVVKQGTPAGSPVPPALTQNASTWEIPLADVYAANGFSTISALNIIQRQQLVNTAARGFQPIALPQMFVPGGTYASSEALAANGGTLVVPFLLTGNMLIHALPVRFTTTGVAYSIGWDIYIQDNNDFNDSGDAVLRRVASSNQNFTGTFPGAASTLGLALSRPILLPPGAYWVAVQNRHATQGASVACLAAGVVAPATGMVKTTTNPNGITLDVSTAIGGWTPSTNIFAMYLRGYFGDNAF